MQRPLHLDGHQPDAALFYASSAAKGILTSLDGGGLRPPPVSNSVIMISNRFAAGRGDGSC